MNYANTKSRRTNKTGTAKRGLRSLGIAIAIPLFLTLANIFLFGWTRHSYRILPSKPFWIPRPWALHLMDLSCAFLMGLSVWLFWAEGGFHQRPRAVEVYMGQLILGLVWDPMGGSQIGLLVCLALCGAQTLCCRMFRGVNPIAGDLVKPCVAWSGFLTLVNLRLVIPQYLHFL